MLVISSDIVLPDNEWELTAVCSQGKGGQNVNKVSTAIHLRFDINASSLPDWVKARLLQSGDSRITKEGVVVIKAQSERSQERNRDEALSRLAELIRKAMITQKPRRPTRPTRGSLERRLETKAKRSTIKKNRQKIDV
ncbi:aminoacyl-tRNA hydrolase [Myxococcota bacterium]|nr:aminoacyl-tRNA hydrolase [Myxococcota bacterium]MBU1534279.1 aminoacyl-tRNA hydrolase [Myxococcota bacterium]